jgi:hypothetical protein
MPPTSTALLEYLHAQCCRLLKTKYPRYIHDCARKIRSSYEMLQVLERYEEIRLDESETWSVYFEVFCQTVISNIEFFLRVITMYNRQHYINLLSLSFPYTQTLNTSMVVGSGMRTLIELISSNFKVNGELIVGLLGPILGLSESMILSLNFNCSEEENFPVRFFPVIRRIYRFCAEERSEVVIRLAEILSSGRLNEAIVKGLSSILWDIEIRPDDIGLVAFMLQKNFQVLSKKSWFVTSSRQLQVAIRFLEATKFEGKYFCVFRMFSLDEEAIDFSSVRFNNHNEPLEVIYAFMEAVLKRSIWVRLDGGLLKFCITSLSEIQRSKLVQRILTQLASKTYSNEVKEKLEYLKKVFHPDDFLSLMKSNLFTCEDTVTNLDICRSIASLMCEMFVRFSPTEKKRIRSEILKYCGDNVYLLRPFFDCLQRSDVLEARYFENKLVNLLNTLPQIDCWDTISRFSYPSRAKFWKLAEKMFLDDIDLVIHKLGSFNIGRCFNTDFLSTHSARSQYLLAVFKTSGERSDYLCNEVGTFKFPTDSDYTKFGNIYDRLVEYERASRYDTPHLDIEKQQEIHKVISDAVDAFSGNRGRYNDFPSFLVDLMIRYRIDDEHLFHEVGIQQEYSEKIETYIKLVYNDPLKSSVDLVSVVRKTYYMDEYYCLLNCTEYLDDQTNQALVEKSEGYFDRCPAFVCFANRSNNVKKYENKIVNIVCNQFRHEDLRAIDGIVKHKDLSRVGRIQIFAHWLFVDEMPEENSIWAMNSFVNLCMDIQGFMVQNLATAVYHQATKNTLKRKPFSYQY